jgi:hypothetical protein
MTTALAEKNIIVKDSDGNVYSIPPRMEQQFIAIKEASINAVFGSSEWHEASDELNEQFATFLK